MRRTPKRTLPQGLPTTKTTTKPHVVGIDYSMTCPALCYLGVNADSPRFFFVTDTPAWRTRAQQFLEIEAISHSLSSDYFIQRGIYIGRQCVDWIESLVGHGDHLVAAIEAYAFAAKGQVFHIGEHTGLFKYFYHLRQIQVNGGHAQIRQAEFAPLESVPPTVVKKFATGKGNAKKDQMVEAFLAAYKPAQKWVDAFFPKSKNIYQSPLADLADAYWIARWLQVQP
jgi:hypothetical protein